MPSKRAKSEDRPWRKGRSENLNRGRKKGDPPTRKLSEQKVTEFCLHFLTNGESIKGAALRMNISPTYMYEFFRRPQVQAKLRELRATLGEKVLQNAANSLVCSHQFLDEHLAAIIAKPDPHPVKGFSDQVAAARLVAEMNGFIDKNKTQNPLAPIVQAQFIQNNVLDSDVYVPEIDRRRRKIHDPRSQEIERKLLGSNETETATMGAEDEGSSRRNE